MKTTVGGSPEALARWALDAGLRIAMIAIAAYLAIRIGSAATRRFEREMSRGTGLDVIERTKRARTLGRLIQNTLSIVVTVIAGSDDAARARHRHHADPDRRRASSGWRSVSARRRWCAT